MNVVETRWKRGALLACIALACGTAGAARATDPPATVALALTGLTGPAGADLYVKAPAGPHPGRGAADGDRAGRR